MFPTKPEDYTAEIFLGRLKKRFADEIATESARTGPDTVIDEFKKKTSKRVPLYTWSSILFVFPQPLPVGSKITQLVYERSYGDFRFSYDYTVENHEPFFVIENRTLSEDSGGLFAMRVFINGHLVAERKIPA